MNELILTEALKLLTEEQIAFLCKEYEIDEDTLKAKSEEELDDIYDAMCDAEIEEITKAGDGDLSERGEMVCSIVTVLGNEIAKAQGDYDEEGFEKSLSEDEQ